MEFEGDRADFLAFLRSDPRFYASDEESYLHRIAWIAKTIEARLPRFFSRLPSNPYGISVIPEQIAPLTTTAYYRPGAGDGTRAGQYFVNLHDLPSRPLYELPALGLHESVPGHHLQISFQGENRDLPDWRRFYYFHAFGEGWGLYSEFLGEEMGMYTTPYERFGRLIYDMWRAARLVVDTGLHAMGWTRDQAIEFMLANTGLTRTNVIAEVDRYTTYPGQATAYKHGELKIRELRRRAENALGDRFDLRDFHVQVLSGGSLPLTVLDNRIQRWIDAQAAVAHHDIIVRGGTLYDGSGGPGKALDLAITDDRITAVGNLDRATADRIVDAAGMAISPGLINMLSWAPGSLIVDGRGLSDLVQGVTLEVFGEGFSMGPLKDGKLPPVFAGILELEKDEPAPWQTVGEYLQWLEQRGVSPNVASFVGATTLRMNALGDENRAPTPEDLQSMRGAARQAPGLAFRRTGPNLRCHRDRRRLRFPVGALSLARLSPDTPRTGGGRGSGRRCGFLRTLCRPRIRAVPARLACGFPRHCKARCPQHDVALFAGRSLQSNLRGSEIEAQRHPHHARLQHEVLVERDPRRYRTQVGDHERIEKVARHRVFRGLQVVDIVVSLYDIEEAGYREAPSGEPDAQPVFHDRYGNRCLGTDIGTALACRCMFDFETPLKLGEAGVLGKVTHGARARSLTEQGALGLPQDLDALQVEIANVELGAAQGIHRRIVEIDAHGPGGGHQVLGDQEIGHAADVHLVPVRAALLNVQAGREPGQPVQVGNAELIDVVLAEGFHGNADILHILLPVAGGNQDLFQQALIGRLGGSGCHRSQPQAG